MNTLKKVNDIINALSQDEKQDGFTKAVKGNVYRYVVGLTHNSKGDTDSVTLASQVDAFHVLDNISLGGWTDSETLTTYIDVSTSFHDLYDAKRVGKIFNQIAIFDIVEMKEIRL